MNIGNNIGIFHKDYRTVNIQGFLSGLPFAAITSALQAQFIAAGSPTVLIGSLTLLGQIYLYKFLLASFSDSYLPLFFSSKEKDRNQGWIKLNQVFLVITLSVMAALSAHKTPFLLIFAAFLTTIFSAFQDVNIDSYRIKLLNPDKLSQGSTYYLLGFRVGMLFSGGLCIVLGQKINWHFAYTFLVALMILGMSLTWKSEMTSDKSDDKPPKTKKLFRTLLNACDDLKKQPSIFILIFFIMVYGIGDAFTIGVNNIFLVKEMHFTLSELAFYSSTLNIIMLLLSTLVANYCFRKFDFSTCLIAFGITQTLMISIYVLLANIGAHKFIAVMAILMEGLSGGLIATAIIIVISRFSRKPFITTQFAILSALAALKNIILGPLAAIIVVHTSWSVLYTAGLILSLPGISLAYYLNKKLFMGNQLPADKHCYKEVLF